MKIKKPKKWKRKVDNRMHSYGEVDYNKKLIRVNKKKARKNPLLKRPINKHAHRYPDVLDTIVHEEMHVSHPKRTEKQVRRMTKNKIKRMSPKQKKKHYNKFRK